jgi:predicted PurR-regulated permease PerM
MANIFTPFLAAFILAYALRPIALLLERLKLSRALAASIAIILGLSLLCLIVILLASLIRNEIPLLQAQAPIWLEASQKWLEPILAHFSIQLDWTSLRQEIMHRVSDHLSTNLNVILGKTAESILASGSSIVTTFVNLVLTLFVLFYLLIDWEHFFKLLHQLIPVRYQRTVAELALETDLLLSQYLRGQISVIFILAIFYSLGLSLIGIQVAIALGVFTALMILIPYIGITLGLSLGIMSVLLEFGVGGQLIGLLVLFGIGQLLEGFYLTPRLVGERIGLHPVAVLFALLFFGSLFGFFGILLALPASAVSLVLIRFVWSEYSKSKWYQK